MPLSCAHDGLGFKVFFESFNTPFPTIARLLIATERGGKIRACPVNVNVPGA
jgi:hypothetical protein